MLPDQSTSFLDFKFTRRSKNKTTWGLPNRNDYIAICIISFQILFEFFLKVSPYIYESECEEFGFFLDRYTIIIIFLFQLSEKLLSLIDSFHPHKCVFDHRAKTNRGGSVIDTNRKLVFFKRKLKMCLKLTRVCCSHFFSGYEVLVS